MLWAFIILILIIACFVIPRLGVTLLVGAGIIVGGLALIIFIFYAVSEGEKSQARKRISPNEIQLTDLRLRPEQYSNTSYKLSGRVKNNSTRYALENLSLKITMRDCIEDGKCETVGEEIAYFYSAVPAGQSRELDRSVYFSNLPALRGYMQWSYAFEEIMGK